MNITIIPENEEIIPQAHRLENVVTTTLAVSEGVGTCKEISAALGMVERQGAYHASAARFLGFIYRENGVHHLTHLGEQFLAASTSERAQILAIVIPSAAKSASDRMGEVSGRTVTCRASVLNSWIRQIQSASTVEISAELTKRIEILKAATVRVSATTEPRRGITCSDCWTEKSLSGECQC